MGNCIRRPFVSQLNANTTLTELPIQHYNAACTCEEVTLARIHSGLGSSTVALHVHRTGYQILLRCHFYMIRE